MESCRDAERALVAALVLGQADLAELNGRVRASDFTDPAAALVLETVRTLPASAHRDPVGSLVGQLRAAGELRADGYPLRDLVGWLPAVPVPAHPEAWAALVVAGSLGRLVAGCGTRLVQASETALERRPAGGAGRVLAVAVAQRAAVRSGIRRWSELPAHWRDSLPPTPHLRSATSPAGPAEGAVDGAVTGSATRTATRNATGCATRPARVAPALAGDAVPTRTGEPAGGLEPEGHVGLERELLSGVLAAPALLDRMGWLRPEDFAAAGHGRLFAGITALHRAGRPVDLITLAATVDADPRPASDPGAGLDGPPPGWRGIDPRGENPASAVFLARRLLTVAVVRRAHATGRELEELARMPASGSTLCPPMLRSALACLDELAEHGDRWRRAHVDASRDVGGRSSARTGVALLRPSVDRLSATSLTGLPSAGRAATGAESRGVG